jgi:small subunit ribosomal protein S4e
MANKGGSSHLKRLAAPKYAHVARKRFVWLAKPIPGAHAGRESVTLLTLLRDILGVADNAREAKRIIRSGDVLVDGRPVKRERFPVGLMDVVGLPKLGKFYRVAVDSHERMKLEEVNPESAGYKLCKVSRKGHVSGKRTQIGLHDGRNILFEDAVSVGDTVKIAVPGQKVLGIIPLKEEARCLVTKGKHAGVLAKVEKLHPRRSRREAEATLKDGGGEFTTVRKYLFAVGDDLGAV